MRKLSIILLTAVLPSAAADNTAGIREFQADGIKVILKPAANQVVSARWFIPGGTANYVKEKEGIEALAISIATSGGTESYPKEKFHAMLEQMGSGISGSTSFDFGVISLQCVREKWNESWKIFAEVLTKPSFYAKEFELSRDQLITAVRAAESNPDESLDKLTMEDLFVNHPYAKDPNGSEASLKGITLEESKAYYKERITKSGGFLVVVGNITAGELEALVKETLGTLPAGDYREAEYKPLDVSSSAIKAEDRDIATNYIQGIMNAPPPGTRESMAMRAAVSIFRDRLFEEVRTKRNLSYAPSAFYRMTKTPYNGVYVSTTDPDSAVKTMIREIRKVKKEGFKEAELVNKKEQYLTGYYMGQETNASQASTLGSYEIMQGGWEKTLTFVGDFYSLTLDEVSKVFDKYTNAIRWYYVGKKEKAPKYIHLEKGRPW